ncbi:16891_t:CDS:2, partial [Entrophospora sp. SA101]
MKAVRHVKLEKSPGRKMAVQVNMVLALLCIFKNIINFGSNKKSTSDINVPSIAEKKVGSLAMELLQEAIVHPDPYLRNAASDALGKLLSIAGGNLIPTQMQLLVDQVVSNRDPDTRAGSALALGSIYSNVGSMAAELDLISWVANENTRALSSNETSRSLECTTLNNAAKPYACPNVFFGRSGD